MERRFVTVDGNEAAAYSAFHTNEVIAIYPITPASPMGELSDAWAAKDRQNIFGVAPKVIEMQSEAGAAGAVHGALQGGALTTTFTASQGLLLMLPNMYKVAGELTPGTIHVSARTVATHALSIFGDHSDVMAARMTGWALLCSNSVQEAQDFALISQAATLESRLPFLHFFDGFRTSHEVGKIEQLSLEDMRAMLDMELVREHRRRALSPDHPVLRGSAQNPDVFFQAREACSPFYAAAPEIVEKTFQRFAELTGRNYGLFDYVGAPDAEHVIAIMGSGAEAAEEAVEARVARGDKVGMVKVRLYRPFSVPHLLAALPRTATRLGVLDRTKEPGATGEPLYQDIVTGLSEAISSGADDRAMPRVYGGRYGLSSKEFTASMVWAIFDELQKPEPKNHFTIGIYDDVSRSSLTWDPVSCPEPDEVTRAVFYGLGSDGTVGANKNTVKIIGEETELFAQGYFVYDSRKAGSTTVSHLRFSKDPIRSTYLISEAQFVACHQFNLMERMDVLELASKGATFLLNSPYGKDEVWDQLPLEVQEQIIEKELKVYVIDGLKVAREAGMGGRINIVMQTCFFALSGILPKDEAIAKIKEAVEKTYGHRGEMIVKMNNAAVDAALAHLDSLEVPGAASSTRRRAAVVPAHAPEFVQGVLARIIEGRGDLLPVSAMPIDGTFPTATAQYDKRSIATEIPIWDAELCTECGLCAFVCPHSAIRIKAFEPAALGSAPAGYKTRNKKGKDLAEHLLTVQVAPDDCTGCGVCVDVCPAKSKEIEGHRAIDMLPKLEHLEDEQKWWDHFLEIPDLDREKVNHGTVKDSQLLEPLFEFSGACSGCGETPYLSLLSRLFGDRILISNATGCSSIYGGNLPTTPWTVNSEGRGPAWINSLFEDNAEFGLGMRLALDKRKDYAEHLLRKLAPQLGDELVNTLLADGSTEETLAVKREGAKVLSAKLEGMDSLDAADLRPLVESLCEKSVWIVGGDGWAYDIGYGGLDHVLACGYDVNLLVLDTGVYSNTGGQASKATPRAAVAKFASGGKPVRRKDLGLIAAAYGSVYVAQVAMSASPAHAMKAFHEAATFPGTSLIIAYSQCIAHGIDMETGVGQQKAAVKSGFWPLFRYDPRLVEQGKSPFRLDSRKPRLSFEEFANSETRFAMLKRSDPKEAARLFELAQQDIDESYSHYEQLASLTPEGQDADELKAALEKVKN